MFEYPQLKQHLLLVKLYLMDPFPLTVINFALHFPLVTFSSGLWSPVSNPSSPDFTPLNSFSAFGNSFNLTGGECLFNTRPVTNKPVDKERRKMRSSFICGETLEIREESMIVICRHF